MNFNYIESDKKITFSDGHLKFSINYEIFSDITQGIRPFWAVVAVFDMKEITIIITSNPETKTIHINPLANNIPDFDITFDDALTNRLFINFEETKKRIEERRKLQEQQQLKNQKRLEEQNRLQEERRKANEEKKRIEQENRNRQMEQELKTEEERRAKLVRFPPIETKYWEDEAYLRRHLLD